MTCGPTPYPLCIAQRSTWSFALIVGDQAPDGTFTPSDPTSDGFDLVAVDANGSVLLALTNEVGGGITVEDGTDPDTGDPVKVVTFSVSATESAALRPVRGTYNAFWRRPLPIGSVNILTGPFEVERKAAVPT